MTFRWKGNSVGRSTSEYTFHPGSGACNRVAKGAIHERASMRIFCVSRGATPARYAPLGLPAHLPNLTRRALQSSPRLDLIRGAKFLHTYVSEIEESFCKMYFNITKFFE